MSLDFFDSWRGVENIIQPFLRTQTAGRTKPQRVLYSLGVGSGPWEGLSLNTGPCEPVSKTGSLRQLCGVWTWSSGFYLVLLFFISFHFSVTFVLDTQFPGCKIVSFYQQGGKRFL